MRTAHSTAAQAGAAEEMEIRVTGDHHDDHDGDDCDHHDDDGDHGDGDHGDGDDADVDFN